MLRKIYVVALSVFTIFAVSCKIDDPWTYGHRMGKGYTVSQDAAEVIEDYLQMATVALSTVIYHEASNEEKIRLERTTLSWYTFNRKDDALWEVSLYYGGTHYVEPKYGSDGRLTEVLLARYRNSHSEEGPLYDTCRLEPAVAGKWKLEVVDSELSNYNSYGQVRNGAGVFELGVVTMESGLPHSLEPHGSGKYISTDHRKDPVEVGWEITEANYDCFSREYKNNLRKGTLDIVSGKPAGDKDRIHTVFDRQKKKVYIEVNGQQEVDERNQYF